MTAKGTRVAVLFRNDDSEIPSFDYAQDKVQDDSAETLLVADRSKVYLSEILRYRSG
jgi:hypothetical protein